jgi:hypothetical protein
MYGENGQIVDLDQVREAIAQADVLIVGFATFPQRLLIDSRSNDAAEPMARVVEPLRGVEERMHWLGRARPQFGLPERFTFFVWPHSVGFLEETGIASQMFAGVGAGAGTAQLAEALDQLHALERQARRAAVTGDHWRSLWDAQGTRRGR